MGKRISRLLWVVFAALTMRACVFEPVRVTDESMAPKLTEGDVVLVSKLSYGLRVPGAGAILVEWNHPKKGDLVVAVSAGEPPVDLLRRIEAIPGDKVTLPDGKEAILKPDEFFLRAEQSEGVIDSRQFGPVLRRSIIGKATYVWLSKNPSAEAGSKVESKQSTWRILQPIL
ncbi:MAG: signal peptidase I [Bdellovibrionota bacterium]